jgi:hypothetical protein
MCAYIARAASSHLSSSSFPHFGFRPLLLVGFTSSRHDLYSSVYVFAYLASRKHELKKEGLNYLLD